MNFVPENQNGSDPYFDRRVEPEHNVKMSDHLLFSLGQLSISEYQERIGFDDNQSPPKRTFRTKVSNLDRLILAS